MPRNVCYGSLADIIQRQRRGSGKLLVGFDRSSTLANRRYCEPDRDRDQTMVVNILLKPQERGPSTTVISIKARLREIAMIRGSL
jgi:hypothetical protein